MKFIIKLPFVLIALMATVYTACTDPIDIELDEGTPQLNIDAFITDKPEDQKVRVVMTTNYFDNLAINPEANAEVKMQSSLGQEWTFNYSNDGYYILPYTDTIVRPFVEYTLLVTQMGKEFVAKTMAFPTVAVDSILFFEQIPSGPGTLDGFIGEFWGRDMPNFPNFYWIKTYIDDTLISDPNFINLSFDAAQGEGSDGLTFIPPIRTGITTFPNIFQKGERVRVEIHGISFETYQFIIQAQSQITNGGLFATPPYNVVTNIENTSGSKAVEEQAVGWFSVATVKGLEVVVQ